MSLVSISDINTGDAASKDLFNSRFSAIVNVLNGNIDAANITNSSITYSKLSLAAKDIPVSKINLDPTTGTNAGTAGGSTNYIQIGTFLVQWGTTAAISATTNSFTDKTVTFPVAFATAPIMSVTSREQTVIAQQYGTLPVATTTTGATVRSVNTGGSTATAKLDWIAIGKSA